MPRRPVDREAAARAVEDLLSALGLDPHAGELRGTGARVAAAFADELTAGYDQDPRALLRAEVIALSEPGARGAIVCARDLPITTTCPHHLMTAQGRATIAFEPDRAIVGVGALAAVLEALARRLTLQETIGEEAAGAVHDALAPRWVACRVHLSHACLTARGERAHGATLDTLAVRGAPPADVARVVGMP